VSSGYEDVEVDGPNPGDGPGIGLKSIPFPSEVNAMQMKKLFKILVVGGSALALAAGSACGAGSNSTDNSNQLTNDGGGGVHGW